MMTMAHAAVGAALGRAFGSRRRAAIAAVASHALLDLPRHNDLDERREGMLVLTTIGLTGAIFGARSREFWCGFLGSAPDLEHVFRRRSRGLYPTHRFACLHDSLPTPRLTARTQIACALALLAVLAWRRG
jgi:hypothetical protein